MTANKTDRWNSAFHFWRFSPFGRWVTLNRSTNEATHRRCRVLALSEPRPTMSDATNTAPKTRRYAGTDVVVMERVGRCIHSRNCVLGRPDVFVPNAPGDWILPDAAGPETVIALTRNCPCGNAGWAFARHTARRQHGPRPRERAAGIQRRTDPGRTEAGERRPAHHAMSLRCLEQQALLRRGSRRRRLHRDRRAGDTPI